MYRRDIEEAMYWFINEVKGYDNIDRHILNQLRGMFTASCIIYDIEADTWRCDNIIRYTYNNLCDMIDMDKEDFYNFMVEYIV